ncbi:MAG: alpha/beta hydrolase [Rhodospirillales bacterium]|nr:alpha/beta hydrolase [Rhodospirillales bacterium]
MRSRWVPVLGGGGFRKLAYTEWGEAGAGKRTLICVHGLTRVGRDFDYLAEALSDRFRVICPDVAGRGQSDWLADAQLYDLPLYMADMASLIARLDVEEVDWLGTSMGGLVGLLLAAQPMTPIKRLILNDVGAVLSGSALARIAGYVGSRPLFPDIETAEAHFRKVHAPFGALSDIQWRRLAETSLRPAPGGFEFHYDPKIALRFKAAPAADVDLWPVWHMVTCPVLAIRGQVSDLLSAETLAQMAASKPGLCRTAEIPGCGHAPSLMDQDQIGLIRDWLLAEGT